MNEETRRLKKELEALEEEKRLVKSGPPKSPPASVIIAEYIMRELQQHHPELSFIRSADELWRLYPKVYDKMKALAMPKIWDAIQVREGVRETLREVEEERQAKKVAKKHSSMIAPWRYLQGGRGRHGV